MHDHPNVPGTDTPVTPPSAGIGRWLREGLRAGFLLRPRPPAPSPRPVEVLALVAVLAAVELLLGRLEVEGPASFDLQGWLAPWWSTGAVLLLAWIALSRGPGVRLASWFALWTAALLVPTVVSGVLGIAQARQQLPGFLYSPWAGWGVFLVLLGWMAWIAARLAAAFGSEKRRQAMLAGGLALLLGSGAWLFPGSAWHAPGEAQPPRLVLSQEVFERQQRAWEDARQALAPQRPGVVDVYGLVFAPYAEEDVFLREATLVTDVLSRRFDAAGRVLTLVNHATTAATHPWATPMNLQRAIDTLARRMDPAEDVLVLYLTSHGARGHELAASHGDLKVDPVSPSGLRTALDRAGIRHRVVAVSACYSGGWIAPLADEHTLVMTAADATHTSYGCGMRSPLTFFGRAVFDEQLRTTHSFEQAFAAAVPVIDRREREAGKPDGFSNPQIAVGEGIRPVLRALEQRLGGQNP